MAESSWKAAQTICGHCDHRWASVCPEETESVECPQCGGYTAFSDMDDLFNPPLHLVVSRFHDGTYLKVSRECDRIYLAGLLSEVLFMLNNSECAIVKPSDCSLSVILSVEKPEDG